MNTKVRKLLSVMLSLFVFVGVITTPVLATEAEPVEETVAEETEVVMEEAMQEEVTEPAEEIATTEEVPTEEIATTDEEEPTYEGIPEGKEAFEVIDEEMTEINQLDFPGLGDEYVIFAEGDEPPSGDSPTISAGKTVTDTDGDGIYELALNVKATSQQSTEAQVTKSNVVMVIDVSGSMGNDDSWIFSEYTYDASTYNSNSRYYNSTSTNRQGNPNGTRLYYRNGAWRTTNSNYGTIYTGTVYLYETRLDATKRAANAVVDALLAYNVNDDEIADIFEITVVKFAGTNQTSTVIQDSTNANAIHTAINGLTANGGTNWQRALEQALVEANYFKNTDPSRDLENPEKTSVIFLTDGFPTYYGNDQGYSSVWGNQAGQETDNNINLCYTNSRAAARNIVSAGFDLYNIFAFGSDTTRHNNHTGFEYIQALANYAYGSGDNDNYGSTATTQKYCFNAKSTADLIAAFNTIINHITDSVGFAGVDVTDGVSLGATSTSVVVNGTAHEESMRYTVTDANNRISYTVTFSTGGSATFTIYNTDGTTTVLTDDTPEQVTNEFPDRTVTSELYSVTVGDRVYKMAPATINASTGMVEWDLAGLGILESGYTYTVAFDVWPNQVGYDIAADMNNGIYTSIDDALDGYNVKDPTERQHIKDAIIQNADGSYSMYTNYEQNVSYYPAESSTDEDGNTVWEYGNKQQDEMPQPDPIPLKGSQLPLHKIWESGLAESELHDLLYNADGTPTKYGITLHVWMATTEEELDQMISQPVSDTNKPYQSYDLGWDENARDYVWARDMAVAPGMMLSLTKAEEHGFDTSDESKIVSFNDVNYLIVEPGHYYYVTESGADLHFELVTDVYHPMIVDGTLYDVSFKGSVVEEMIPMGEVIATNYLKGGLNIHKIVSTTQIAVVDDEINNVTEPIDENGIETVTDEFTFEIKIWKTDDEGNKSPVYTYDEQINTENNTAISGSIGYRVFSDPSWDTEKEEIVYGSQLRGAILTEDSPYKSLANGIYATIDDNETTIVLTMPANGEIRLVNLPAGTQYSVNEITDETGTYTYAATKTQIMEAQETDDPEPVNESVIIDIGVTTDNFVSGKISGNKANVETYYNWTSNFYVYHSSDNTIEKISFADERVKGTYNSESGYIYTFNIADEVKTEKIIDDVTFRYLYGGYYESYMGAVATDEQINGTADEGNIVYDEENWGTDAADAMPYTYKYISDKNRNVWGEDYYTVNGTAMNPEVGKIYYLKEVQTGYLQPYTHYTYYKSNKNIATIWTLEGIDDLRYAEAGFVVKEAGKNAKIVNTLKVAAQNSSSTVTLTPANTFKTRGVLAGYLGYTEITTEYNSGSPIEITQWWKTLDGITVYGTHKRTLTYTSKKYTDLKKTDTPYTPENQETGGN